MLGRTPAHGSVMPAHGAENGVQLVKNSAPRVGQNLRIYRVGLPRQDPAPTSGQQVARACAALCMNRGLAHRP